MIKVRDKGEQWLPGAGWGEGRNGELVFDRDRASVQEDEKTLRMDGGDGYTTV